MTYFQPDFISMTLGYVVGVFFCWSLCELIYRDKDDT